MKRKSDMKVLKKSFKHLKRKVLGRIEGGTQEVASLKVATKAEDLQLVLQTAPNKDWVLANRGNRITFVENKFLNSQDRIFTMGSCFAVEIRKALTERGYDTYPKYDEIEFDPQTQMLAKLPERDNVNHYNTFVIMQEFELALEGNYYDLKDLVDLGGTDSSGSSRKVMRFQDPYRKMLFSTTETGIVDLSGRVTDCIRSAIREADVYVITLGLTEVWRNERNGLYVNQAPKSPGKDFVFVASTFQQNYDNLARVCSLVAKHFPNKRIVLTVSPVPLTKTFTTDDVVVANTLSKSTLRAVAGQIAKDFSNATYWPSYEIALARDLFEEDGRHVRQEGIKLIVEQFQKVHAAA
jgi:hypothetical protein